MIPFEFAYYKPGTISEATDVFWALQAQGKTPVYYGGGSELISMARMNHVSFDAVIDLKGIPECNVLEIRDDRLFMGAALTLSDISESKLFPLMGKCIGRIADHTMQCKITMGGNLAGTIIYREAVLPLLLTDGILTIATRKGLSNVPIHQVFRERLHLKKGEFLVRAAVQQKFLTAPYFHMKKTKNEKIDYPLITAAGLKTNGKIRIAFSGLKPYPFRYPSLEVILNNEALTDPERAEQTVAAVSADILEDLTGSAAYRAFVLQNMIENVLTVMKDV